MRKKLLFLCFLFYLFKPCFAQDISFLALADIHFDPYLSCYAGKSPCATIVALQQAPVSQWATILSTYEVRQPAYRQDTGYALLRSSLIAAKQAAKVNQVQFVLILGDFLGHDYKRSFKKYASNYSRASYHQFVRKTMEFLTNEISNTFPDLDIYSIVGNNDSYSADYGFYPTTGFFSDTGMLWSSLIKNQNKISMRKQFSQAGYYAVDISPHAKLIALNTVLFSNKANGKGVNEAANKELKWLENELMKAKKQQQKVFIAMHIPPGIDIYASLKFRLFRMIELWEKTDAEQYEDILQKYATEIAAIFAGHLHVDLLQVLKLNNQNSVPMITVPSISPFFGNKPRFNVYIFSNETFKLINVENYSYSLGSPGEWGGRLNYTNFKHKNPKWSSKRAHI